jgi:hypothetical protein
MAENKTKPTNASVEEFVAGIDHAVRRSDVEVLLNVFSRIAGMAPRCGGKTWSDTGNITINTKAAGRGLFSERLFTAQSGDHNLRHARICPI